MKPTLEQLSKINRYSRRELSSDEVFVFEIRLCDTNIDKDYECFSINSLNKLSELYLGKTGILGYPDYQNQSARIFETKVHKFWNDGYLSALAYMVKCDKNKELILEIETGIKKEISIGCNIENIICSICKKDVKHEKCEHKKGETYDVKVYGDNWIGNAKSYIYKKEICHHILENPTDTYNWSFVKITDQILPQRKIVLNPQTGISIQNKCEKCSTYNEQENKYCKECGSKFLSEKERIIDGLNFALNFTDSPIPLNCTAKINKAQKSYYNIQEAIQYIQNLNN